MIRFIKNLLLWPVQVIGETILLRVRLYRAEREIELLQAENLALSVKVGHEQTDRGEAIESRSQAANPGRVSLGEECRCSLCEIGRRTS